MLTYLPAYHVLICTYHHCAVYGLDEHLKRLYKLPAHARRDLLVPYYHLPLLLPEQVSILEHNSLPLPELGMPEDAFACCYRPPAAASSTSAGGCNAACTYITTS